MSFDSQNTRSPAAAAADGGVRSVEVALQMLELLAGSVGPVRVTEIAQRLELGKPRVCRHLATLEAMGLVRRVGRQGYSHGERLTRIAHQVLRDRTLGDAARPALQALRDELRQTVTLAAPTADGAVVLSCYAAARPEAIRVNPGTVLRYPHSPAARLAVALGAADAGAADAGAAGSPAAAGDALKRWRAQGVDYEVDTQGTGLGGVAAPVFAGTLLVGLVSVVVSSRVLLPKPPQQLVAQLRRSVAAIEGALAA